MVSLLAIKNFIAEKKTVTLATLLTSFAANQTEILAILEFLMQKGYVKKCMNTPECATRCFKCRPESFIHYQWLEPAPIASGDPA